MAIKNDILKRLEKAEKRCIPKDLDCMVFIEDTEEKGVYTLKENIYTKKGCRSRIETIKANNAQEIADNYKPPEGCKEPLVFMVDYVGVGE